MILSTTDTIPEGDITAVLGLVMGNVVETRHIGTHIASGLKELVGGELRGYTKLMTDARRIALDRLVEEAVHLGADAVVSIRFVTSQVISGAAELLAYGTAVRLQR